MAGREKEIQEIWEILKKSSRLQKENIEQFKETDRRFKETDLQFKETDKKIKEAFALFTSQWGKLVESLVEGDIVRLFKEWGLSVHDTSTRRKGNHNGQNFEFDIIVHNGDSIVVVEVKTTLKVQDVKEFVSKLKMASTWMDEYKNYKVYGAMAYLKAEGNSNQYAEGQSLFVIRATGKSASIKNGNAFVPRIF